LLNEMEKVLARGVKPEHIAFCSFTRAAVTEATERACIKFGLDPQQLPYFRTLHSLAFRELALRRVDVLDREDLHRFGEVVGENLTGHHDLDSPTLGEDGDGFLFLDQYARATGMDVKSAWHETGLEVNYHRAKRFADAYTLFRDDIGKVDFTDMLEQYAARGIAPNVSVAIIDEAQDLTPLAWQVVDRAFGQIDDLWVAGDDDQTLYGWCGAKSDRLFDWGGQREVLSQSYRLPKTIFNVASDVVANIEKRNPKTWHPRDAVGEVEYLGDINQLDLSSGRWLMLARTRYQLKQLVNIARAQGVAYSRMGQPAIDGGVIRDIQEYERDRKADPTMPVWYEAMHEIPAEDRSYIRGLRRRGEDVFSMRKKGDDRHIEPRVRISTIHGAKGLEADNVFLLPELTKRVRKGMELNPDAERRVQYVAVTRARERLVILNPTRRGYQF
jgi:DNA helicase-2/ATP-dependent DNA helicase PcrA